MPYLCLMILYNVTVNIDADAHEEWLNWMQSKHIPDVMATGCFANNRFCRLLNHEETGFTYSVQYLAHSMDAYEKYREIHAPALQREHTMKFQNKFVTFRTLMEVVGQW